MASRVVLWVGLLLWPLAPLGGWAGDASGSGVESESANSTFSVRYPVEGSEDDRRHDYYIRALELALEKSRSEYGDYQLVPVPMAVPKDRILRTLSAGEGVDVAWGMTSREREAFLRPVRFPLLRGMTGYRLLIVRDEDKTPFRQVQTLKELSGHLAGQQGDWPDTEILRSNALPVTTGNYESLFAMLQHGRFDYIPRAFNEPWEELAQRPELDLSVEPNLLLHYVTAIYFFVHSDNQQLAERLNQGLHNALKDGSFEQLFFSYPINRAALERAGLEERRILRLENPLLPERTPVGRKELWWTPNELPSAAELTGG